MSVRSIQHELVTLKRGATRSGTDPQSGSGMQYSSTDIAGLVPPPDKKSRLEDDEANSDEEIDGINTQQGPNLRGGYGISGGFIQYEAG